MSEVNIETLSKIFLYFVHVSKNSKYLDSFRIGRVNNDSKHFFPLHYLRNLGTGSCGYEKYRISGLNRKKEGNKYSI